MLQARQAGRGVLWRHDYHLLSPPPLALTHLHLFPVVAVARENKHSPAAFADSRPNHPLEKGERQRHVCRAGGKFPKELLSCCLPPTPSSPSTARKHSSLPRGLARLGGLSAPGGRGCEGRHACCRSTGRSALCGGFARLADPRASRAPYMSVCFCEGGRQGREGKQAGAGATAACLLACLPAARAFLCAVAGELIAALERAQGSAPQGPEHKMCRREGSSGRSSSSSGGSRRDGDVRPTGASQLS